MIPKQLVAIRQMNCSLHMLESRIEEVLQTVQDLGQGSVQPPDASCSILQTVAWLMTKHPKNSGWTVANSHSNKPQSTCTPWPQPQSASTESTAKDMRTIEINGFKLTFNVTSVPSPPRISFADNVDLLFTEWYSSQKLLVTGHGIPIRHWDKFYMKKHKIKEDAWISLRSTWNNWRVSLLPLETLLLSNLKWWG